jgi:hypothetical protein
LSAQLAANTAAVDDSGRLWIIDNATGDLTRVAGARRTREPQVTEPGNSILALVDGGPVVVNTKQRKAITINPATGKAGRSLDLDLRPDDSVQAGGSPHRQRLYLVASRGVLTICDLSGQACDQAVPLGDSRDLGAPIEAGNRLFVPDYGSGQVWIVDLTTFRVVAKPQVLTAAGKFQLLNRDGVVFFNDPVSEQAGVIQLDGTVDRANKYDPKAPDKGVNSDHPVQQQQPAPAGPQSPASPAQNPPADQNPPPAQNPPGQNPPPAQNPPPNDPPPLDLHITLSKLNPQTKDNVTLSVDDKGARPADATWDFADGSKKETGYQVGHQWKTAREYLVTVQVVMSDGRSGTTSVKIPVSDVPKRRLTVTTNDGGIVSSADGKIQCKAKSTCFFDYDIDTHVSLTPHAATDFAFSFWGDGNCSSAGATCELTMSDKRDAAVLFKPTVARLTVKITAAGGTVKLNGQACNGCTQAFNPGTNVSLEAFPDVDHDFDTWDARSCADPHGALCTTQADTTREITAKFKPKPKFALTLKFTGQGYDRGRVKVQSSRDTKTCLSTVNGGCTYDYVVGEQLTLTADSVGNPFFAGWHDACQGAPNDVCHLTMTGKLTATADYGILH